MAFKTKKNDFINHKIGVVIPALNEEESIALVITGLFLIKGVEGLPLVDEVIIADNGSKDKTALCAFAAGAKVVYEPVRGYGHACMKAISALTNVDIIVFIDGDHAFFPEQLPQLLLPLTEGKDLVIGSRTQGNAETAALTPHQKWGNRLAVMLINYFWQYKYTDLGPYRSIKREVFDALNMQELTYGWTIEMQIKALQQGYQVCEVPVDTRVRLGESKVSGTLRGSIGAGVGIISTALKLYWQQKTSVKPLRDNTSYL